MNEVAGKKLSGYLVHGSGSGVRAGLDMHKR